MDKKESLSKILECEIEKIVDLSNCLFEFGEKSYLVCTEEEAIQKSCEYIEETLWAFRASFLVDFIPSACSLSLREERGLERSISSMQEEMCESCNPILRALIGKRFDDLINSALCNDPMEFFLADYDHKVVEIDEFLIYRKN